ncbi:MAG TPA: RNA methyltransferase [Thermoplasmata archaeon]|nr:RNA methyltransferase [Thermoplasmata archaeon]HEV2429237.1 RNA methyltransferase [Thermoplasmata archaeon]
MTARLDLVLVRPKEDGNVGAVARVARNFGVDRLVLVAPRAPLGQEARRRAMGGLRILTSAKIVPTFDEAIEGADLVAGTSDLVTGRSTAYLRRSVSADRLGELLRPLEGRVALVFGPEDNGLGRHELERCDLLVHVGARRDFPTLNLSHAVAIVLYARQRAQGPDDPESTPAPDPVGLDGVGKEIFLGRLSELLARTGYPAHKRPGMVLLFRRVLGRAVPSESEIRMMLGFLKSVDRSIGRRR